MGTAVPIESRTTLLPYAASVGAARRFVRDVLSSRQVGDNVVATAELLTSEVVTNAIVHGVPGHSGDGANPVVVVRVLTGRVRIEVHDPSPTVPAVRHTDSLSVHGWGMSIVDELSACWGVEHVPRGKRVWFEVPSPAPPLPAWVREQAAAVAHRRV